MSRSLIAITLAFTLFCLNDVYGFVRVLQAKPVSKPVPEMSEVFK